jgi:glycerophosphoryl diester phosphodiesterase
MAGYDNLFHPDPATFVALVLEVINQYRIEDRTVVQCFDQRILQEVKKQQPEIITSLLVEGGMGPINDFIELGFKPGIYSPNYLFVNDSMIRKLHKQKIAVIPWTVNDTATMNQLIKIGVDGIITDYPELLLKLVDRR